MEIENKRTEIQERYALSENEIEYFVFSDTVVNNTYSIDKSNINILMKNGNIIDITSASDQFNSSSLEKTIKKHFFCYPKLD